MADFDEDMPITSLRNLSHEDNDPDDETQDFRFLASLTSKSGALPKRGEKDFEPHGTKHQDGVLTASRQAMHNALDYTRTHAPKTHIKGFWYGEEGLTRDDNVPEELRQGLDDDHVVVIHSAKGPHFKAIGKMPTGQKNPSLWLLPEEALYLIERGTLDLWWPTRSSFPGRVPDEEESLKEVTSSSLEEEDEGVPMSLQAAFAVLIGSDDEKGKVSMDRYTVYANLKRTGYAVMRALEWDATKPGERQTYHASQAQVSPSVFNWLFGKFFAEKPVEHAKYGPLVKPGMYRSYNSIYRQIAIIPRHKPSPIPNQPPPTPEDPYRVIFQLWKPSRLHSFTKSNPGMPDFRVAVTDARSSTVPSLTQITTLLESTPYNEPDPALEGPTNTYQRIKHGWRNVVLAVVDQGVISYLRLGEAAFGEEKLYERFDRGSTQGNKRGGGAGRGRGGRRGRGRK